MTDICSIAMEHLPIPKDANFKPFDVPYVCRTNYDRGAFLSYPSRRGWKLQPDGSLDLFPIPRWLRNTQKTSPQSPTFTETAAALGPDPDYDDDSDGGFIDMDESNDDDNDDDDNYDDNDGDDDDDDDDNDDDDDDDDNDDDDDDDDEDHDGDGDGDDDEDDDLDCFIQTWLFFGCLIEIFGIVGIPVHESDFIRDKKYITTAKLPKLIEEWKAREESSSEGSALLSEGHAERHPEWEGHAKTKAGRYLLITTVLEKVQSIVKENCYGEIGSFGPNPRVWGVDDSVSVSIMALGCALKNAASSIYNPDIPRTRQLWGTSDILTERFNNGAWCRGEQNTLMNIAEIDGIYYFGSLNSPRALSKENHANCILLDSCVATIDTANYKSQHAKKCRDCECEMLGNPVAAAAIVKQNAIPLVTWTGSELKVVKYNAESKPKYLAISHVWSDGMGNQKDNKLPQCQLERLQDMMNSLYSEQQSDPHEERLGGSQQPMEKGETREKPVGFWMDTLCIPVPESPELDSSWAEGLRKDAIVKMRYVYEAADKVLVIDSWIQELSRSASIIDKAARIFLSNWQHRLWTLQEGVLARHLFFQFADGTESLEQLWYQQGIESKICPGLYSSIVHCTLPLIPMAKPQLKERAEEKNLAAKVLPILEVVTHRKTSKLTDETICIATLLNFEEKSIRKILGFKSPEERMRAFLVILGEFHQNIIFCEFPMLQTPGFRWAPRSFLNQTGSLWPKSANELSQHQPGDRFSVLASSGGLHVTFPGIKLGAVNRITEKLMCVVPYHDEQTIYGVLLTENLTKLTNWSPDNHYGIISSAPIHGSCGDITCLFGCLKDKGQEGIIEIQRLCNARLKPLRNFKSERGADTTMHLGKYGKRFYGDAEDYAVWLRVWGEFLEEDQKWCVV